MIDLSKATPITDAVREVLKYRDCDTRERTIDILRFACPKEPPSEWIEAMRFWSFGRVPIPEMERQWRKQPLWLELWGDET